MTRIVLLLLISHAAGAGITEPRHAAVNAGASTLATFACRSVHKKMRWDYYPPLSNESQNIYDGETRYQSFSRVTIIRDRGDSQYDLLVSSVQMSDAGTYVCYAPDAAEASAATLTVFETEPKCTADKRPIGMHGFSVSEITCTVNYAGDWTPTFTCSPQLPSDHLSARSVPSQSVTYSRRRFMDDSDLDNGNETAQCTLHFNSSDLPRKTSGPQLKYASAVPEYAWKVIVSDPDYGNSMDNRMIAIYTLVAVTGVLIISQTICIIFIVTRRVKRKLRRQQNTRKSRNKQAAGPNTSENNYDELERPIDVIPTPSFYKELEHQFRIK